MRTPIKAMVSLATAAMVMSTLVACGPAIDAQAPKGGANDGAAPGPIAQDARPPPTPPTEAECRVRASSSKVSPPPAADGDVAKQYDAFFLANQETFRCCFDALYAPKVPRTDGQVVLYVKVEASGKLASSEIVSGESTAQGPELNACFLDVVRAMAYPAPASNAPLGYKRRFQFKARY